MKSNIRYLFGEKLRMVRERRGMTLKKVAYLAGVSESLISQIERNRISPSLDTLISLTEVLEIDLEYLFKDYKKNKKVSIVRCSERNKRIMGKVSYYQLSVLPDTSEEHVLEAVLLEIYPGGERGDIEYGHTGKEWGVILEGEGELLYGAQTYILKKGDSISFPSDIPHILKNRGKDPLKAIWVITPPRMFSLRR